jgi:tRNA A-37 threonylcarbamoyl transferase component Bud32
MQDNGKDGPADVEIRRRPSSPQKDGIASSYKVDEQEQEIRRLFQKASPPIDWNPTTFTTITTLNLPVCGLSSLPSSMATYLPNLSILFCPNNNFQELPEVIGSCPKLQMVSFKSNGMKRIHPNALQPQLRWLILTDNALQAIPRTIGRCHILQKLMLSGNALRMLPEEIGNCKRLELVRLASNQLLEAPMTLLRMNNLAWAAFSDNPFLLEGASDYPHKLPIIDNVTEGELLGQGASGVTHRGVWNGRDVAVKTFSGSMTSDGNPLQERTLALAASRCNSPCLIQVLGQTLSNGSLVMELLENFTAFADPPSMESCSRDVYQQENSVTARQAVKMVAGLLDALVKLHECGICHGDFYGHNILIKEEEVRLSDFGAAFFYDRNAVYAELVERMEMRAFAHLLDEIIMLLSRSLEDAASDVGTDLVELRDACRNDSYSFPEVQDLWRASLEAFGAV